MYKKLEKSLSEQNVTLVAVSKTRQDKQVMALYDQGQRILGENRVNELERKSEYFPKDVEWHMIGHLQSKKVKNVLPIVSMIQSVDSKKLYDKIVNEAAKIDKEISVLLQYKIGQEEAKYGLNKETLETIIHKNQSEETNIKIKGLMGMASFVDNQDQVRAEFAKLKSIYDYCKSTYFATDDNFCELSMGMSGDYIIAIEEGATMVRIGSLLFG
ncbi:YggS family pyridoxal phosphate-dependent enzyme [Saprospiraceae bacterium]|jgi:pyridoxal phosphate enzyme (YggS family)|nr:YggS family pyridoxal phosphate-dependent enzyme [Saprospiraceae bacterium]HCV51222.1 YggS family pyridoxal phosphate-dependent enzyme [Saprospirales bacterium]MDA9332891.1 YggS family pyridoxal phosphate-dependent enzyme [Saprospiraceae bacterium]MDB4162697.1 YggS family pyridoxal phosphate-dependent enzyme [Saprospiraceae bacterium]MDB4824852.1 YggS family pyridoxal phosphate-dependent enzyme [Saprospiraceae bacterium]